MLTQDIIERPPLVGFDRPNTPVVAPVSTDWDWFRKQAELSGRDADTVLADWDKRRFADLGLNAEGEPIWPGARNRMMEFRHERIFTMQPDDVLDAVEETEHAFGGTTRADRNVAGVQNMTSISPFAMVLHSMYEVTGRVPRWQDFEGYVRFYPKLYLNYVGKVQGLSEEVLFGDWTKHRVMRSVRYRLATAYNSWIREAHFLSVLRHRYGLPLLLHSMLDAEWKIDFMCDDIAIELFLKSDFKDDFEGRKLRCHEANPARDVMVVAFELRRERQSYTKPWLIHETDIERTVRRLERRQVDYRADRNTK